MEKIDMERASEELEYLDALIEKYQSKLQTITVNDIFKQELKRSLASLKLEKIKLIKQIETKTKSKEEILNKDERVLKEVECSSDEFNDDLFDEKSLYNFKIVYQNGKYRLDFDVLEDGNIIHQTHEKEISVEKFESRQYKEMIAKKYNINPKSKFYKYMDIDLLLVLEELDTKYNTNYVDDYKKGKLDAKVKYDLKDIFSDKSLKPSARISQRRVAFNQRKIIALAIEKEKYPSVLIGGIATAVVLSSLGIMSFSNKKNNGSKKEDNSSCIIKEVEKDFYDDGIIETENKGLKLGDSLKLINKDNNGNIEFTYMLSEKVNDDKNKFLASNYSSCDKFVISSIVVCKDNKVLKEIKNFNNQDNIYTNELYDKYGKDIDVFLGFDAHMESERTIVYYNIGWLNLKDFESENSHIYLKDIKKLEEEEKQQKERERRIDSLIESMANDNSNNQIKAKTYVKK